MAEAAVVAAQAGLTNTAGGSANMPKEGISAIMHGALEGGKASLRDLGKTMLDEAGMGESKQPSDMPVAPSMPKEIQLELQHHAIIAASLDGDLYGRDMGRLKGWVVKYKRNLYKDICMPSDHVAAADYMANKVS